jgi:hypothetical protein
MLGLGMTCPHAKKSGVADFTICSMTGFEISIALREAYSFPAFTNGVRRPGTIYVFDMVFPIYFGKLSYLIQTVKPCQDQMRQLY